MGGTTISFFVRYGHNPETGSTYLEVVEVERAKKVQLRTGSFLLRIQVDEETLVVRCHIRHIASGREAHMQGGSGLRDFVSSCLLHENTENEVVENDGNT